MCDKLNGEYSPTDSIKGFIPQIKDGKCENCDKLKAEIDALENRVEELEEQLEPEDSYIETRRTMMEDYD